jgi:hypothetical protein
MVKSYILREKSAECILRVVTEWEFSSCGMWKVRKNGWRRELDVSSFSVLYMVCSRVNVGHGRW